jgi:hypothetical protein
MTFFLVSIVVPRGIGKKLPPAAPHTCRRHEYNGVLPGALRGSFTTLDNIHPSATQPSARCLTPGLRWFDPLENKTFMILQDLMCTFGGRGVSQMTSGSATLAKHASATRENRMKGSPLGLGRHSSILVGQTILECRARSLATP